MAIFRREGSSISRWGIGKNRDSRPICGIRIDDWWSAINNLDGGRPCSINWYCSQRGLRGRPFTMQTVTHQWILFIAASMDDHDEQNLFVRSDKSKVEVTNNRKLRSTYCSMHRAASLRQQSYLFTSFWCRGVCIWFVASMLGLLA